MIKLCADDLLDDLRKARAGMKLAQIIIDDGSITVAKVSLDHLGRIIAADKIHLIRYHRTGTDVRPGHALSVEQLEVALNACLDDANLPRWEYDLLVVCLPFSVSRLIEIDQSITLDDSPLIARFHDSAITRTHQALRAQVPVAYVATDFVDRHFTTDDGLRLSDPRHHPTRQLGLTGKLVVTSRVYCAAVRRILAKRNIHPHLIISGPLSLRGFLDPRERRGGRIAVLHLDRLAARAAVFDAGGLRRINAHHAGTAAILDAAQHHFPALNNAQLAEWRQSTRQFPDFLEPDVALGVAALDAACTDYAGRIADWFQEFLTAAALTDDAELDAIKIVSEEAPVGPCLARLITAAFPNVTCDVVGRPRDVIDYTNKKRDALRVRALAQEVCATLASSDPLDYTQIPTPLSKAREGLLGGMARFERWTTRRLPTLFRNGAVHLRATTSSVASSTCRLGSALRTRFRRPPAPPNTLAPPAPQRRPKPRFIVNLM